MKTFFASFVNATADVAAQSLPPITATVLFLKRKHHM
jgi:hypothetical protein